ncbi:MAG: hypothetical protein JXM73_23785 [Anaerolineae bacterium]|nr:hypothetical protein [Anaerolineae bacterium]
MDYGKVLTRAWQITWRWKVLWILGFLASLGQGGGGGGGGNITTSSSDWEGLQIDPEITGAIIAAIVSIACVAILIGIALWVVSVIARGGLIAGVQQVEDDGSTTFGRAWRVGVKRFWTLFGINILATLPAILMWLVFAGALAASIVGLVEGSETSDLVAALSAGGIGCAGLFCCLAVIVTFLLSLIQIYAERAAVLEGMGWIEAFKRGWQVLKTNIGPTLIFWLIFLVIGMIVGGVVLVGVMAVALPIIGLFTTTDVGAWVLVPICGGGLAAMILGAIIGSVVNTFTSATWTLAYREMIRGTDEAAVTVLPAEL